MCGIVGVAGDLACKDEMAIKRLLLLDYFRGPDSTGLAAIRSNGDALIAKINSSPIELFDMGRFKTALNGNISKAFIGHNRAATRGVISTANAHPFHYDHIVGVHNGTLDTMSVHRLENALSEKFAVDSMALIAGIARLGVEAAIGLCSDNDTDDNNASAWSLVWYDQTKGTLNFLRNKKRPMFYCFTKDFKRMLWASEWQMLQHTVQCSNGGYDLFVEEETGFRYRTTDPHVHYEIDLELLKAGGTTRPKFKAREVRGCKPYVPMTGNHSASGGSGGRSHDPFQRRTPNVLGFERLSLASSSSTKTTGTGGTSSATDITTKQKILHLESSAEFPLANVVTLDEFENMVKQGCSYCGTPILDPREPGLLIYQRDDQILGTCCSGSDQTRIIVKTDLYL